MGMDESMTKQETKEMMEQLEKVFSIVRILDVEGFETANSLRKKKNAGQSMPMLFILEQR